MKIRSRYSKYDYHTVVYQHGSESITQQQFKEECDINNILAKYKKTGMLTHINHHEGKFGDFSNVGDYQTALTKVMEANENFLLLPAELRKKFDNDPGKMIEFISNPENEQDVYKYGLAKKPDPAVPTMQEQFEKALDNHETKKTKKPKE